MTFGLGVLVGVLLAWVARRVAWPLDARDVVEAWHGRERRELLIKRYTTGEGDRG